MLLGAVLLEAVLFGIVLLGAVLLEAVLFGVVLLGAVFQSLEPELSFHSRRQVLLHGQAIKVSHREAIEVRRMHTETHISLYLE